MKRPEAQNNGTIVLTGLKPDIVLSAVAVMSQESKDCHIVHISADYCNTNTSWRVLKLITGNTVLSNLWYGIHF